MISKDQIRVAKKYKAVCTPDIFGFNDKLRLSYRGRIDSGVLKNNDREILVGFFPTNLKETFNAGTIVCEKNNIKGQGIGRITSVTYSPELGHWIGLGFVKGGLDKWKDTNLVGADPVRNKQMNLKVVSPHMIDPKGERMYA